MKLIMCLVLILLVSGCVSSYEGCMKTCKSIHDSIYYDAYEDCKYSKGPYKISILEDIQCVRFANAELTKFCYNECK